MPVKEQWQLFRRYNEGLRRGENVIAEIIWRQNGHILVKRIEGEGTFEVGVTIIDRQIDKCDNRNY